MDLQEIRESLLRDESVRDQIARRAYEIYSIRGYGDGREVEDWMQAENEILNYLLEREHQRLAMEQAALEPVIQGEEPVSAVAPAVKRPSSTAKKSASKKAPVSKAKSAGKAPKKAASSSKTSAKKTST